MLPIRPAEFGERLHALLTSTIKRFVCTGIPTQALMSQNLSEQCMRWDGDVTLTTAVSIHRCSLFNHSLQTSCVLIVGYVCASLVSIFLIRCAVNLFKQTEDAMHLFLAFMTAADLLLTGKDLRHLRCGS